MCGIAGVLHFDGKKADEGMLRKMTQVLNHRGPDGEGYFLQGALGLGHRRLSVVDLSSAGSQPMTSFSGRMTISYNGEVYNFKELRRELEGLGHRFFSHTDTEVVLTAYEQWGENCLNRLNGMFAFAIWDHKKQELFLARDRYGIKPFYYGFFDHALIFASEQKAILEHASTSKSVDLEALLEYFTFQNIFTQRTFLQHISIFPSGCWARISSSNSSSELDFHQYWDFKFEESIQFKKDDEAFETLDQLFQQAVKRQLVSDVELGTYLSGGMDSGSITAVAAESMPYIKTFTCGFDLHSASGMELGFDERDQAELMSYLFKTEHYEMVLKAGDMERIMPQLAWHMEEPRVGQSYPNFYISQLAGKFVKVVLSGVGGDELFGGYPWRYYRAAQNENFETYIDNYYHFWQRLIPNTVIQKVFKPVWSRVKHVWTRDIFKNVLASQTSHFERPEDYLNQSLYFEAKTFLHGLLVMEDKLSMAHGLEVRVPFLDNDLVDFAMKLPIRFKLAHLESNFRINENEPGPKSNKYYQQTQDGKLILRQVMSRHLPDEITKGVKRGFSSPDASWFKGESMLYIREQLFNPQARIYDFFDPEPVQSLVTEHLNGKQNRRLLIWSLLSFEWWLKRYM